MSLLGPIFSLTWVREGFKKKLVPRGEGAIRSPPATPHCLLNPKWPQGSPKMADGACKGVYPSIGMSVDIAVEPMTYVKLTVGKVKKIKSS